jgi:hypothetical protein
MRFCRILSVAGILGLLWAQPASAQFGGMPGMPGMGAPGMGAPGMGAPGMGGPGFGAPQAGPPPACQQLMVLRDETKKYSEAIGAAQQAAAAKKTRLEPAEACKLFKVFLATDAKFVQGLAKNSSLCGVPQDTIKQFQEGHAKAAEFAKQICDAAEHPQPTGPTLSDALNSTVVVPNADNTNKTGRGIYDTMQGNALAR